MAQIELNGHVYEVHFSYAGMSAYTVYEDGIEVYYGFSPGEIIDRFGFNPNSI